MTIPAWVKGRSLSVATADESLHSGVTTDLIRGNLQRVQNQSFISYQSLPHSKSSAAVAYIDFLQVNALYGYSTFGLWPWPMRRGVDGDFRPVTTRLRGKLIGAAGTLTIRMYLLDKPRPYSAVSADFDYDGFYTDAYSTMTFTTTTWAEDSCTISSVTPGLSYDPINHSSNIPANRYSMCWFQVLASCTSMCSCAITAPSFTETC